MDGGHVNQAGIGESADSEALGFGPRSPAERRTQTRRRMAVSPDRKESMTGSFDHYALVTYKNPVRDLLLQARPLPPAPPPSTSPEDLGKTSTPLANPTIDGRRSSPPSPSLRHRFSRMCPGRCTRCPWYLMSRLPKS